MSAKIPVTVVIPVKNEEKNLPNCLAALGAYDEVVIVDSGSTDRTEAIAREWGADYLLFEWNGQFPKKRNWYLMNHQPRHDWVLFLDADEVVNPAFDAALRTAIASGNHVGYWLNYTNYFLGQRLDHGVAQRKLALFRKDAGLYERIDEQGWSKLDMEIHEHPVLNGSIGEITPRIDHRDFQGLEKFLTRHIDYAKWETQRVGLMRAGAGMSDKVLTGRQNFKYRNIGKFWFPAFYFLFNYIVKLGFLDGGAGFQHSFYKFWYFQTIRQMMREQDRNAAQR